MSPQAGGAALRIDRLEARPPLPAPAGLVFRACSFERPGQGAAGPLRAEHGGADRDGPGAGGHPPEQEGVEAPLRVALPESLHRAVAGRRAEFLAGRLCAMAALRALTGVAAPVPVGPGRAPLWPEGVAGSLTHSGGRALAVVGRAAEWPFLGLDLEPVMTDARAAPLADSILAPGDAEQCPPGIGPGAFTTLVFCAKEAVYKAVYPRVRRVVDFQEARVLGVWPGEGRIELAFEETVRAPGVTGRVFALRYAFDGQACISLAAEGP
ncbi:4'-phosphopantetheinyl transferase superfamily protein (plasmid) [Paroceanicella profunda]|uniref:Enterobactin synthase component D n=1 Tax=Paroceanicella profunda TaxID=2579971 RepID=A0A5B8G5U3_9RHOB|nr:4'-phosphopantetheinyl transferase superfamily protein [Paroceanicella profunda]QDL94413.1 4'-phosphopantetheinyl transferase superfamily protein [Paroceanicella profunda]